MSRWADERAVTVQIGAVLLLAIVFSALALYQVNAVPAENQAIESEHNQQVHDELQELRNAIRNVGTSGGSESVSVTLGTSYPTRTFLTNPTDPTGTLRTSETGTVRIDNASVDEADGSYTGNPDALLGTDHETRTLRYEPSYNEYRTAPTTRLEHGFAFNDFGDATVALTEQPLIDGDRITIVLVEGNLSTSSSSATTVDTRLLSGPTDPVDLESDGGNITITLPTRSPTAWNETIGTDFGTGEERARVTAYADGNLTIELENESAAEYELQMARVGVGDASAPADDPFDVRDADGGGGSGGSTPAYYVDWQDPSGQSSVDDSNCDSTSCIVTGDEVDLTMETDETAADAGVEYAVSDQSVGTVSPSSDRTDADGTDTTTFTVDSNAVDGDTVNVYTSSGSDGDKILLEIDRESGGGQVLQPVEVRDTGDRLVFRVENTGSEQVTVEKFEVDATGIGSGITIDNGNAFEGEIRRATQNGEANRKNRDVFNADGTRYDLVADSNKGSDGQYAIIDSTDDSVEIDFRYFSQDLGTLAVVDSAADADVTVTLVLSDGSEQVFYFERQ
ncbi:hypothetical protein [Natrinema salinisoli]|uniref:hypothetical protein n=1 Tax=Natrinema salinisoli TaxID=2878535 RepID=UPI001CF0A42E|nr:hypothetical protein [Natrinema salinisoli]